MQLIALPPPLQASIIALSWPAACFEHRCRKASDIRVTSTLLLLQIDSGEWEYQHCMLVRPCLHAHHFPRLLPRLQIAKMIRYKVPTCRQINNANHFDHMRLWLAGCSKQALSILRTLFIDVRCWGDLYSQMDLVANICRCHFNLRSTTVPCKDKHAGQKRGMIV